MDEHIHERKLELRGSESYLQDDTPVQLVFLCVPQTHLPVMTTAEENILRGVSS